jgi:rRNA maturation endonuclease Nob1
MDTSELICPDCGHQESIPYDDGDACPMCGGKLATKATSTDQEGVADHG